MAKLKAKVAKLEEVQESAREFYTKGDDGAFYLDADGVDDMPAVIGLKRNRDLLKEEKKSLEEKHSAAVKTLEEKIEALEKGNKGGKNDEKIADLENKLKQLQTQAATEKSEIEGKLEKERGALRGAHRRSEIAAALAKHGGNPKFLMHLLEPHVKVDLDGESYKVTVIGADGSPRIKSTADPVFTVDDLVAEAKANKDYAGAFASAAGNGSGAADGRGGAAAPGTVRAGSKEYFANLDKVASGQLKVTPAT